MKRNMNWNESRLRLTFDHQQETVQENFVLILTAEEKDEKVETTKVERDAEKFLVNVIMEKRQETKAYFCKFLGIGRHFDGHDRSCQIQSGPWWRPMLSFPVTLRTR